MKATKMKTITYVQNLEQLEACHSNKISEIILEPKELSRFGKLNLENFIVIATKAKEYGIKVVLEWDILLTESQFTAKVDFYKQLPADLFASVRVQDMGPANYVFEQTDKMIQLILENGNHNLKAIKKWISTIHNRIERVALSSELQKDTLASYVKALDIPVEILALGRILLFYTPRNLLSALTPQDDDFRAKLQKSDDFLEATGESEESPHKGFPLVENTHGTFMFHIKRLYLLENIQELNEMGMDTLRVDFRFDSAFDQLESVLSVIDGEKDGKEYRKEYGHDVIRGFFNVNKSDVLFKKLKNSRIQRKDDQYSGEVIEIVKGEYSAVFIKGNQEIELDGEIKFITPVGKELICKVHTLKNVNMDDVKIVGKGKVALVNYMGGVVPKSQVYYSK